MAPSTWLLSSAPQIVIIIRFLVVISYFALTILFYVRAPSAANATFPGVHVSSRHLSESSTMYPSVGIFGEAMIAMLGPTDVPFTIFAPSHAAFLNVSSIFRKLEEGGKVDIQDSSSDTYAVMSHLLSFSTVAKPIFTNYVPVGQEAVYESLSGSLLSLTRVLGRGLLVNNLSCVVTDLQRERFVIHIVNGVLMDSEFEQSIAQDTSPGILEGTDETEEKEEQAIENENQTHV